jgi:glycosyltransferase involved in cell wall biosynthesis
MRITMVLDSGRNFPPDIRVEKEAAALSAAGHDVRIVSLRYATSSPPIDVLAGTTAKIFRLDLPPLAGRRVVNAVRALLMFDWRWIDPLRAHLTAHPTDVLHVHDLPLVPVVNYVARDFSLPVVADLHENMPAAMRAVRSGLRPLRRLAESVVFNYHLMRWLERRALRRCSKVLVVVPEAAERLYVGGIDPGCVVLVSNTEDESTFPASPAVDTTNLRARYAGQFVLSYIGSVGVHRGLQTVIRGLPQVIKRRPDVRLLVVGAGDADRRYIARLAEEHGVTSSVEVVGWVKADQVDGYLAISDICLVPHEDLEHTNTTVPHKLFQYMLRRKAVLVSSCPPLARIVRGSGAGAVFKAGDASSFAEAAIAMADDPDGLKRYGGAGWRAATGEYSWTHDARRLIEMYASLVGTSRQST